MRWIGWFMARSPIFSSCTGEDSTGTSSTSPIWQSLREWGCCCMSRGARMRDGARDRGHAFAPLGWHHRGAAGRIRGGARGEYIAMSALLRVAATLCLFVFVAGCSETSFQDVFGAGKDAPDETQVRTNQALVLPPDLALKAPGTGTPPPPPPPVQVASTAT